MAAARSLLVLATSLLVVATLLAPGALAQAPTTPDPTAPCGKARLSAPQGTFTFAPGETQTVTIKAAIGGGAGVDADASVVLNVPAGWRVDPPKVDLAKLRPNDEVDANFQVTSADPPAQGGRSETLSASGTFACYGTLQGQRQKLQDMPAPAPVTLTVRNQAAGAAELGTDPLLVGAGALALLAVAAGVYLVAKRRKAPRPIELRVDATEARKTVRPGRGTSFPLQAVNNGAAPDAVRFEVVEVPEGWTAFMAAQEVQLAAKESRVVWLMVRAPGDEAPDKEAAITVRAHSQKHPQEPSELSVRATVALDETAGVQR